MTELREELKVKPREGAVEYAERTRETLEGHHQETGEKINPYATLDGEGPGETLERLRKLNEAGKIEVADRERKRVGSKEATAPGPKETSLAAQKSSRSFRLKSQERDVERAASAFEGAKKKLYRADGTKFYGDEEHTERLSKLREEFSEKLNKVVSELEEDAKGYEWEARSYTYTDPTKDLSNSERIRLDSSRPLVAEDCERLSVEELTRRIEAVSAGTDKVAKVLHARYGASRVRSIDDRRDQEARTGRRTPGPSPGATQLRELRTALTELEEQLKDPKVEEQKQAAEEAAKKSRQFVRGVRRRQSEVDGAAELTWQREEERIQAAL